VQKRNCPPSIIASSCLAIAAMSEAKSGERSETTSRRLLLLVIVLCSIRYKVVASLFAPLHLNAQNAMSIMASLLMSSPPPRPFDPFVKVKNLRLNVPPVATITMIDFEFPRLISSRKLN